MFTCLSWPQNGCPAGQLTMWSTYVVFIIFIIFSFFFSAVSNNSTLVRVRPEIHAFWLTLFFISNTTTTAWLKYHSSKIYLFAKFMITTFFCVCDFCWKMLFILGFFSLLTSFFNVIDIFVISILIPNIFTFSFLLDASW